MDAMTEDPQIPEALVTLTNDGVYWQWIVKMRPDVLYQLVEKIAHLWKRHKYARLNV
jgi:hypothetical protein